LHDALPIWIRVLLLGRRVAARFTAAPLIGGAADQEPAAGPPSSSTSGGAGAYASRPPPARVHAARDRAVAVRLAREDERRDLQEAFADLQPLAGEVAVQAGPGVGDEPEARAAPFPPA